MDYISLAEAAEQSPYSQEYLSLRARQGKLQAVKQGRNWVTTQAWLDRYLQQVDATRTQQKAIEVVERPTVEATYDPIQTASAVAPKVSPVKETDPFVFHPAAVKTDTVDRSDLTGSVLTGQQSKPTGSSFSWDDDEPVQTSSTPERNLLLANLQQQVDTAIASDEPAIEVDGEDASGAGAMPLGSGFVELGMSTQADSTDSVPYTSTSLPEEDDQEEDSSADFGGIVKPALTIAVFLLIVVSNFALFDRALQLRRNIGAGAGVVLQSAGQQMIAIGQDRQERREARLGTSRQIAMPALSVDASEITPASSTGAVAGASDTQEKRGFWATVTLGLLTVLNLK